MSDNVEPQASEPASSEPVSENTSSISENSAVTAPATPAEKRSFKLKVEGNEEEHDEDSVIKYAQIGKAADRKFKEAAQLRREAEEKEARWKDPRNVLKELGPEARKIAEEYLAEQLRQEMMSPEERERDELRRENAKLKETDKQRQDREEHDKVLAATQQAAQEYDVSMSKALETTGLPKTANSVKRMAAYMYQAAVSGYDMSADEAASLVQEDYMSDIREIVDSLPDPSKILGEKVAAKLMEQHLAKVKGAPRQSQAPQAAQSKPKNDQTTWLSPGEWRKSVRGY